MKTLLAVLHLSLTSQVPVQDTQEASPPKSEKQVRVFDFDAEEPIVSEPVAPELECFFSHRDVVHESLLRLRQSFDEKVMESVGEM